MKDTIYKLDKALREKTNGVRHGRIKSSLHKNRISYIGIVKAIAAHTLENCIDPKSMVDELFNCCNDSIKNPYAIKTMACYSHLRGYWSDILYQPDDSDPQGQPEQRGKFICVYCHIIKGKKERSPRKNYRTGCQECVKTISAQAAKKSYEAKKSEKPAEPIESIKAEPTKEFEKAETQMIQEIKELKIEPETQEVEIQEMTQKPQLKAVTATTPSKQVSELLPAATAAPTIKQIVGDAEETSVEISIQTTHLHLLLDSIAQIKQLTA